MKSVRIASAFLLLSLAAPVHAGMKDLEFDYPVASSRWGVSVGAYSVDLDTSAAVGVGSRAGLFINLENVLGLETSQETVRLDGFYRIKPKHTLDFSYLAINRDSSLILDEAFEFDGVSYQANFNLASAIDMGMFKINYQYSFFNNGRINAGFQTGLSFFQFETALEGTGAVVDEMGGMGVVMPQETSQDILAPVPGIGFFIDYAAYRWMVIRFSAELLDLDVGDFSFTFQDSSTTLEFYPQKNFAIGLGIALTELRGANSGEDPWQVDYRFSGAFFYLGGVF